MRRFLSLSLFHDIVPLSHPRGLYRIIAANLFIISFIAYLCYIYTNTKKCQLSFNAKVAAEILQSIVLPSHVSCAWLISASTSPIELFLYELISTRAENPQRCVEKGWESLFNRDIGSRKCL